MYQCTWCEEGDQDTLFFLGSALAGYSWEDSETGDWELVLKRARYDLVSKHMGDGYSFDLSPEIEKSKGEKSGTRFGNCAETYPLIEILECVFLFPPAVSTTN